MIYSLIVDSLVVIVTLLIIIYSYKNGFLNSLVNLVGGVACVIVSSFFSNVFAVSLYSNFLNTKVVAALEKSFASYFNSADVVNTLPKVIDSLPKFISNPTVAHYGSKDNLLEAMQQTITTETMDFSSAVAANIVKPVLIGIMQIVLFVILFAVLIFVVRLVAKMLVNVKVVPVIGCINSFLGIIIGALEAAVLLLLISALSNLVITFTGNSLAWFNDSIVQNTYIFKYIYNFTIEILFNMR